MIRTRLPLLSVFFVGSLASVAASVPAPAISGNALLQLAQGTELPSYEPPHRGAPGGRVGGASRGGAATPAIEPFAPDGHTGLTTSTNPTLYYFVSGPVNLPIKFTIRARKQAKPIIETNLTPPQAAGVQAVRLADYHVQLQLGVAYTWSVSIIVNPNEPSNNVVATATLMRAVPDAALGNSARGASPLHRAALYAQAGFWYDALAAAVEGQNADHHAALDALLDQVGLTEVASYDRQTVR